MTLMAGSSGVHHVVLGGSGAVGTQVCRQGSKLGHHVVNIDRAPLADDDANTSTVLAELARISAAAGVPEEVTLVSCAAGAPPSSDITRVLVDNLAAPATAINVLASRMTRGGSIVIASSISSSTPSRLNSLMHEFAMDPSETRALQIATANDLSASDAYRLSKGAMNLWAAALCTQLLTQGIRVNVVSPGAVASDQLSQYALAARPGAVTNAEQIVGRHADPTEVADVMMYLHVGSGARWVNGVNLVVDGGLTRLLSSRRAR